MGLSWRYEGGRFTVLPGLRPHHWTTAEAINARGDVVGTSVDPAHRPFGVHLVVWLAGQLGGAPRAESSARSDRRH